MTGPLFRPNPPLALLTPAEGRAAIPELGGLLKACLEAGAGIGFVLPLSQEKAEAFWAGQMGDLEAARSYLIAAKVDGRIAGVVMLCLVQKDNGSHRADVAKLLVHPDFRRQGLARKLMTAIDGLARSLGRWMLVLDTVTGDPADHLYPACGYVKVGVIPDHSYGSHGNLDHVSLFYKDLRGELPPED